MIDFHTPDGTDPEDLDAARPDSFLAHAVAYLRETFPQATTGATDDALIAQVLDGCDRAARYGLDTELEAMGFVDLQFRLGPAFDEDPAMPWAAEVLADDDLSPEAKVATLQNAWRFHVATEAADGT